VAQQRRTLSHSGILLSEETAIGLSIAGFSEDLEVRFTLEAAIRLELAKESAGDPI
jgi:hypothetical protein